MTAEAVERDYEAETGTQIIDCFRTRDPRQTPMVLVAGHGPFAWGKTADKAVYHAVVLEELAKIASITRTLDPQRASTAGLPRAQALRAQARQERLLRAIDTSRFANTNLNGWRTREDGSTMGRALQVMGLSGLFVMGVAVDARLRPEDRTDDDNANDTQADTASQHRAAQGGRAPGSGHRAERRDEDAAGRSRGARASRESPGRQAEAWRPLDHRLFPGRLRRGRPGAYPATGGMPGDPNFVMAGRWAAA